MLYLRNHLWSANIASLALSESPATNTMTTVAVDELSPKDIPEKYIVGARKILKKVEDGNANVAAITDINAL